MNQQVPVCRDCEHFDDDVRADPVAPMYMTCRHPRALHIEADSAVLGPVKTVYYSASAMRAGICGPLGKLFEPKEKDYDPDYAHQDACSKAGVSEQGPSR